MKSKIKCMSFGKLFYGGFCFGNCSILFNHELKCVSRRVKGFLPRIDAQLYKSFQIAQNRINRTQILPGFWTQPSQDELPKLLAQRRPDSEFSERLSPFLRLAMDCIAYGFVLFLSRESSKGPQQSQHRLFVQRKASIDISCNVFARNKLDHKSSREPFSLLRKKKFDYLGRAVEGHISKAVSLLIVWMSTIYQNCNRSIVSDLNAL